jgi:myo-inositol 2-dehydrogenase / D-chiro-inositol 1-dehydrogenase
MLRIGVIGGGCHSRENHLPALAQYASRHPGEVELAAFCDLQSDVAESLSLEYGYGACYTSVDAMLAAANLDACFAITPVAANVSVAKTIVEAGIPVLMEKPPGRTPEETRELCEFLSGKDIPVMVSMNRRFDPALLAARAWMAGRPMEYVRASILRHARAEPEFLTGTAIHSLDALRAIAGDIRDYSVRTRKVDGIRWYWVDMEFVSGASGLLEVMPTCGNLAESYEIFGPGYRIRATAGECDTGETIAWEGRKAVLHEKPSAETFFFERNGTAAETAEFLDSLREGRMPQPSPREVLQSVEVCHRIQQDAETQT